MNLFSQIKNRLRPRPPRLVRIGNRTIYPMDKSSFYSHTQTCWEKHRKWLVDKLLTLIGLIIAALAIYYSTR